MASAGPPSESASAEKKQEQAPSPEGEPSVEARKAARKEGRRKNVRDRIQENLEKAEEAARKEQFRKRIEVARSGVRFLFLRRHAEAVKAFRSYLSVLEYFKQVPEGGLSPQNFDLKDDLPELLIISGVYWDLLKLYDRTESAEKYQEFQNYVEKYVQFVVGMPYQPMAAETVRKYIVAGKAVHLKEFKVLHQRIAVSRCFIAGSLVDFQAQETTPLLRDFRERVLRPTRPGRTFIRFYELTAPAAAEVLDRMPDGLRRIAGRSLDRLALALRRFLTPASRT